MARTIFCTYLQREAEGLDRVPYPGELGQRIYAGISKEAWQQWLRHQTMLMNEYRLTPIDPKARQFLVEEMSPRVTCPRRPDADGPTTRARRTMPTRP